MTKELAVVDFHGDSIFVANSQTARPMVALRPIVEGFGLQWSAQLKRLKRNPVLAEGVSIMDTPSMGGSQQTTMLPLDLLPGFLFGISIEQVRDEAVRDRVLVYQRECFQVLAEHFLGRRTRGGRDVQAERLNAMSRAIREVRLAGDPAVTKAMARHIAVELGIVAATVSSDSGRREDLVLARLFIAERTREEAGGTVRAGVLFGAYKRWRVARGTEAPTLAGSGRDFATLGLVKKRGNYVTYIGRILLEEPPAAEQSPAPLPTDSRDSAE